MKKNFFIPVLCVFCLSFSAYTGSTPHIIQTAAVVQNDTDDYYQKVNQFQYEDRIYASSIKTVQLNEEGFELSMPVLQLNSERKLKLSFDDLDAEYITFSYTVIHCNANWTPSDLISSEYINGFTEEYIRDYS